MGAGRARGGEGRGGERHHAYAERGEESGRGGVAEGVGEGDHSLFVDGDPNARLFSRRQVVAHV